MPNMQRRPRGINSSIPAYSFVGDDLVKSIPVTINIVLRDNLQNTPKSKGAYGKDLECALLDNLPNNGLDQSSFLQHAKKALFLPCLYFLRLFFPFHFSIVQSLSVLLGDASLLDKRVGTTRFMGCNEAR